MARVTWEDGEWMQWRREEEKGCRTNDNEQEAAAAKH